MLVLSRREGETILIGDDISFKILDTSSANIKIGIDAPKSIRVDRLELRERINAKIEAEKNIGKASED